MPGEQVRPIRVVVADDRPMFGQGLRGEWGPMVRTGCFAGFLRLWLSLALLLSVFGPAWPAAAQAPADSVASPAASVASAPPASAPLSPAPAPSPSAAPGGPAFSGIELPALRTRTSRTYLVGGFRHLVACSESVNFLDASGHWQRIDNTLRASTVSGYAFQNAANSYQLLLPPSLSTAPVKVTAGAASVAFQLVGAAGTLATTANTATYSGALPGVDVSSAAGGDSVQEDLTLQNASAPSSFAFTLSLSPGLTANAIPSGGIDFLDASGKVALSFPAPYAVDSSHKPAGITARFPSPSARPPRAPPSPCRLTPPG